MKKNIFNLITGIFLLLMFQQNIIAQTVLINPAGDGGFQNGSTFAANGWTDANSANNPWVIGTALTGTPWIGNTAYVSNDVGITNAYTNTAAALNFFYRDVTVPASESKIVLTFDWICNGESIWDLWQVFTAPTTVVPVGSTTYPGSGTSNVPSAIAGATFIGYGNLQTTAQTITLLLPSNLAGTTFRLIFGWKNDTSGGTNPPAGFDNISLVSSLPVPLVGGNTYPINGTQNPPTSFASITTAAQYIASDGITGSGQVIFELNTGYAGETGPLTIGNIPGASSSLGVTFRPATGYTALTSIVGGATPNQHAIRIIGSYITLDGRAGGTGTLRDWTIRTTGTNGQMAVRLDNTSNSMTGIALRYLIMEGEATGTVGAIFQITGVTGNTISNVVIENNLIRSNPGASTFRGYGITLAVASNVGNTGIVVRNNEITQFYARGINLTGGFPGIEIYGNSIYHTSPVTMPTTTEFAGIYFSTSASTGALIYNNYIHDIQLTNGVTAINGIQLLVSNSTGTIPAFFNNRIGIGNGITVTTLPIYGINYSTTTATYPYNFYFNSVLVNGSATAGAANSAAFRKAAGNVFNLKNNIFYNARTNSGGTGTHWAIAVNNTTFTSIGNNDYFADGTGGVLGTTDGTITGNKTTLADWTTAVPADLNSVSQNPNYTAGLKIDTAIPTQLESGATPIAGITTDFEGDTRNATTPDIGADEFTGIGLDLTPPVIVYTPLLFTSSTSARTLVASITDLGSGVPTAGAGLPVLYWRINAAGIYTGATATYLSGSNYQFTFGSGVTFGDTVLYYIVAQDNNITPGPNVGAFPSGGAGGFTANPPAAAIPPTSPSSYLITNTALAGDYTVGVTLFNQVSGRNITFEKSVKKVMREVTVESDAPQITREKGVEYEEANQISHTVNGAKQMVEVEEINWIPMENGIPYEGNLFVKKVDDPSLDFPEGIDGIYLTITAAIADLNLRGVSGATTFLLTDATYPTETYPLAIDITNEAKPTSVNTVTFKPNTGVSVTVSGASAAAQIFKIFNSYVTLDGSNSGGTTRNWTIENTSTTTPQVILVGSKGTTPITNVTVKNCIIINGVNSSSALIVSDGNAPGTAGWFNNITIQNNRIQKAFIANYNITAIAPGNGSGLIVDNNDFDVSGPDGIRLVSVYVQGVDGAIVSNNNIENVINTIDASNVTGIWFATGTVNSSIINNTISNMSTTSGAPRGIAVSSAVTPSNVTISGNTITGLTTAGTGTTTGIYFFSTTTTAAIFGNEISNIKNTNASGWGSNGLWLASTSNPVNLAVFNNLVYDVASYGYSLGGGVGDNGYGIIVAAGAGYGIYYNSVYMTTNQTVDGRPAAFNVTSTVTVAGAIDLRDNIFANIQTVGTNRYSIYCAAAASVFNQINFNDYYTTGPNLGFFGASPVLDLPAWRIATGQDLQSISADPQFSGLTDLRPAMGSPVLAAGTPIAGITTDFLGVTRSATNPSMGAYEQGVVTPLSGTYTVGLSAFMQATGKKIYFETMTRTVTKDLLAEDTNIDLLVYDEKENGGQPPIIDESQRYVTVTEEYLEMMEDGKPFDYSFFKSDASRGVYPTINAAVTDLILRGVSGPVTFLLVDSNYPTETYPIDLVSYAGASATNTVTFKPATGVQAVIPGSTTQTTGTVRINTDGQYYIIDGSNTVGGTTRDLTITNGATGALPTVHFFSNGSNNVVKNCILESQSTSTGTGTLILAAGTASNNNVVENNLFKSVASLVNASGVYLFSTTLSSNNTIIGNEFVNFTSRAITFQGAAGVNSNKAISNLIYHNAPSTLTTIYGIFLGRGKTTLVEKNIIKDLHSTAASPIIAGIYYIGASGDTMTIRIVNNVISLSLVFNQTAGTIRGLDYFGWAANSIEAYYNTVYIGGVNVTGGTTAAFLKRDAAINFIAKDNTFTNARSNISGTGIHYAAQFSNVTATAYDMNYNHYYTSGTGGVFGIFGTTAVPDLATWQTLTLQDANSISSDPIFVSATDFRPQTVSPLLDAGVTISGITTDILGDLRGTPPTIGAYENGVFVALSAPSSLSAIPDTFTVDLGWQDNSNNEFGFVIQRKLGDSTSVNPWINIDTVNANVINYLDTGLNPSTMYSYRVFGYNSLGNSGFSNIVEVTTFIPVELTAFTAELSSREILVSWITATELNNRGFDIERKMESEWEKVGFKDGKGTTTTESYYSFVDKFTYESFVGTITYRLKQMDFDGTYAYSPEVEVDVDFTPKEYTLYQNYPNPFNPVTTIKYSLPFESNVRIAVYNILGEMIDVLVDETKQVGFHNFNWNASNLASGIYIYTIEAKSVAGDKNYSSVKKMILMK